MFGLTLVFDGVTEDDYWAVNDKLGINRDGSGQWPDGLLSHHGGPSGESWVVMEIWESKKAHESFLASRLGAALASAGVPQPSQVIETDTINDQQPG